MSTHNATSVKDAKVSAPALIEFKRRDQKITMVTAYDATFARLFDRAGVDVLLVGDSLGMVIQGHENTLSVSLDEMIYHTRAVCRGATRAHVVADMPFLSYQTSVSDGLRSAGRLVKEGGAHSVKLEGGERNVALIRRLVEIGIPVMGHIGLTPQSVLSLGGFKVQGRSSDAARYLCDAAIALQQAGCFAIVLEAVPRQLAAEITASLTIPTIGIGAGVDCDGQVLVCYDLLGMIPEFTPKFVKRYDTLAERIEAATREFIEEVRSGAFPTPAQSFSGAASGGSARAAGDAKPPGNVSRLPVRRKANS